MRGTSNFDNHRSSLKWALDPIDVSKKLDHIEPVKQLLSPRSGKWTNRTARIFFMAWLVACLFAVLPSQLSAAQQIDLQSDPEYYQPVTQGAKYLKDPTGNLNIQDVMAAKTKFSQIETQYLDLGLTTDRIWLHFPVRNASAKTGQWRLDIKRQYLEELRVYLVRTDRPPQLVLSHSQDDGYSARAIPSRFLELDFQMGAQEEIDFFVGYRSTSTTYLPIALSKVDGTFQTHSDELMFDWFLNGGLVATILLALLLIPLTGWKLGISFGLYILSGTFYVANADGYTFQYLWPDNAWLNEPMNLAAMLLMPAMGLSFSRQLFVFKAVTPRFDRFLVIVIMLVSTLAILTIPLIQNRIFMISAYSIIPVATSVQVIAGVVAFRQARTGAIPYLLGAMFVVSSFIYATVAHLVPGVYNLDHTLDYGHLVLFGECLAFSAAIMLRLLAMRNDRDRALRAELVASEEKLRLNSALLKSQKDFDEASKLSEQRLNQLSAVSHDIRQPLVSLRKSLGKIGGKDEEVTEQMNAAFDYLETLAVSQLVEDRSGALNTISGEITESFPVRIVLDNVFEMFVEEAKSKGLDFRYRATESHVRMDPVALMRAVSNIVSNAVKHTREGALLLASRSRGAIVRIEVWDTGDGLGEQELEKRRAKGSKGQDSAGTGLGFSIVEEICETHGLEFQFHSRKGTGSVAFIHLPASK